MACSKPWPSRLPRSLAKAAEKKSGAVIGSGPAGLAAAAQLNRAEPLVTVYRRDDRPGGLLALQDSRFQAGKKMDLLTAAR